MDVSAFRASLTDPAPPPGLSLALQGLWWDGKGDWDRAHRCAQEQHDGLGAIVHAYLHRKEGDAPNAGYWYKRADKTPPQSSLEQEWLYIAESLLS